MPALPPLALPSQRPARAASLAGAALLAAALFSFVAWNWRGMGVAVRLALPGGAALLCLALSFLSERQQRPRAASLALLGAALFVGLFWMVFEQSFQSGSPLWKFCRAWAVCTLPLFLLRRYLCLWNLLVLLLCGASCTEAPLGAWNGVHTSHLLPPLCVAAAACAAALLPQVRKRAQPNAWLALPLALLLAAATTLCGMLLFYDAADYAPSLPERLSGPLTLAAVLAAALYTRHALTLYGLALSALALLNIALLRLFDNPSPVGTPLAFLAANLAATLLLPKILFWLLRRKKDSPRFRVIAVSALGGFFSALSFLALLFLCFADNPYALIVAGALAALGGIWLWRARRGNLFFSVLASVLASGGAANVHIALFPFPPAVLLAGVWAAALLFYGFMDAPALRFSAIFWALVTSAATLPSLLPAGFPLILPLSLFFFLPLAAAACGRFPTNFLRPAAFACLGALLLLPALLANPLAFFLPKPFPLSLSPDSLEQAFMRAVALLCLAVLTRRILPLPELPRHRFGECSAIALALTAFWFFCPLESLLFLDVALALLFGFFAAPSAKSPRDSLLTGAGLTLLALGLTLASFLLDLSFQERTLALGLPGLWLCALGLVLQRRSPTQKTSPTKAPWGRRFLLFTLCAAILTAAGTWATLHRLEILKEGKEILLPLSKLDLRASFLGDVLELSYELDALELPPSGPRCLPLDRDAQGIAHPSPERLSAGKECEEFGETLALRLDATSSGALRARLPRAYAVEQGHKTPAEDAPFALLRCGKDGECLLTGIAGKERPLSAP